MSTEARIGAAIAGAVLVGLPVLDLLSTTGVAGPIHGVVALFGIALLRLVAALAQEGK